MFTNGKVIYPEMKLPLYYQRGNFFEKIPDETPRLCLIVVEEGSGIVRINNKLTKEEKNISLIAPVMFCLNEEEAVSLIKSSNLKTQSLYFHPEFINSVFNFENIRNGSNDFLLSDIRDRHWFSPFLKRDADGYQGLINLGTLLSIKLVRLLERLGKELEEQTDHYWPCRCRSYLLELLFLIERVFMEPDRSSHTIIPGTDHQIHEIIIYLNTNYQSKITISELSKTFHINRTSLNERFRKETGFSVVTYLIKLRLNLAARMLRDSTVPIAEIVERIGFSDQTHFGRMFYKYYQMTPTEYRQNNCWLVG